jgi:hypothetical protein
VARRVTFYGLVQLCFTVISLAAFTPTYFSYEVAVIYQIIKILFPLFYGSRHLCQELPQRALRRAQDAAGSGCPAVGGRSHDKTRSADASQASGDGEGVLALVRLRAGAAQRASLRTNSSGSSASAGEWADTRAPAQARASLELGGSGSGGEQGCEGRFKGRQELRQRPRSGGGALQGPLASV